MTIFADKQHAVRDNQSNWKNFSQGTAQWIFSEIQMHFLGKIQISILRLPINY